MINYVTDQLWLENHFSLNKSSDELCNKHGHAMDHWDDPCHSNQVRRRESKACGGSEYISNVWLDIGIIQNGLK